MAPGAMRDRLLTGGVYLRQVITPTPPRRDPEDGLRRGGAGDPLARPGRLPNHRGVHRPSPPRRRRAWGLRSVAKPWGQTRISLLGERESLNPGGARGGGGPDENDSTRAQGP